MEVHQTGKGFVHPVQKFHHCYSHSLKHYIHVHKACICLLYVAIPN